MKVRHIIYSGRVQGVGFRYSVKQIAAGYDVLGYVLNLPDGNVELWLQGEKSEVDAMEQAILESHLKGFIKEITTKDVLPDATLRGFEIRR